jgi:hypothetical protein
MSFREISTSGIDNTLLETGDFCFTVDAEKTRIQLTDMTFIDRGSRALPGKLLQVLSSGNRSIEMVTWINLSGKSGSSLGANADPAHHLTAYIAGNWPCFSSSFNIHLQETQENHYGI